MVRRENAATRSKVTRASLGVCSALVISGVVLPCFSYPATAPCNGFNWCTVTIYSTNHVPIIVVQTHLSTLSQTTQPRSRYPLSSTLPAVVLGRTAHQSDSIMLRSLFFFFAVSSGSKVNSLTVKRGSKPPSSKDPDPNNTTVVRGWRVDGYLGLGRTPIKAEKALGVDVAPNNDLWEANDLKKYYGACPEVRGRARVVG